MSKIEDLVFGTMEYDYSWVKTENVSMFGKDYEIRIVAEAYTNQDIIDVQRDSYLKYKKEYLEYVKKVPEVILKYYLDNYEIIASAVNIPERINKKNINRELIVKLIKIKTLYIDRKGNYGWLCDCAWDNEHGICILLSDDEICIKEQDYLL